MSGGSTLHKGTAAADLAQFLRVVRRSLPSGARVCALCGMVFVPTLTTDRRCPDCAAAPPGNDCPDHGPYAGDTCPKCGKEPT